MFKFLENIALNHRMKKHQQNFVKIIKQAEDFLEPDDPDFPWVSIDGLRKVNYDFEKMLIDIQKDYDRNQWRHMATDKWLRASNYVLAFIEEHAPEVTYRRDAMEGIYVTTQIVANNSSEKPLAIEFDGHHLEIADYDGKTKYDLRNPISVKDFTDLYLKYHLRIVDNETGTYQTMPRTNAQFRSGVPYELWDGMAQHNIKVTSVTLVTYELVTYKALPKVTPDDKVHRSAQIIVKNAVAYMDVEFENDELERARKCDEIAKNLLEGCKQCKNN